MFGTVYFSRDITLPVLLGFARPTSVRHCSFVLQSEVAHSICRFEHRCVELFLCRVMDELSRRCARRESYPSVCMQTLPTFSSERTSTYDGPTGPFFPNACRGSPTEVTGNPPWIYLQWSCVIHYALWGDSGTIYFDGSSFIVVLFIMLLSRLHDCFVLRYPTKCGGYSYLPLENDAVGFF